MGVTDRSFATFFEVSLDMLCIRDMDNKLVRVNRAWEDVLGYPAEELEGAAMLDFIHPDDIVPSRGHMERMIGETEVRGFINRYRHRDGHYRYLEWRARRVDDLVFGVARDVTERLVVEQKLKAATLVAEAANQAKSDFLATMSHEIRTPLNGVIGVVDALSRTDLAHPQRDMVTLIQRSGETLERLVSDILDVSKIEAGKLQIETRRFDLRQELNGLLDLHRLGAEEKGLVFRADYGEGARGEFRGDVLRIKQVLGNLLSNAVKFTAEGAVRVRIDVAGLQDAGQSFGMTIEVRDSGIGFEPEFASALFARFTQADSTITRRFGGSGLGLSICKSLVDLLGGEITAEAEPGRGSLFRVRIPLLRSNPPDIAPAKAVEAVGRGPGPRHVLLAEDHPINRKLMQILLAPYEARLTMVENGAQALEAFRSDAYDLVLMDMQMPIMDGLTATRAIRRQEEHCGRSRTPIIMLTANAMTEHRQVALAAGADLHLAKPVTAQALTAGIDHVWQGRGAMSSEATALQ